MAFRMHHLQIMNQCSYDQRIAKGFITEMTIFHYDYITLVN